MIDYNLGKLFEFGNCFITNPIKLGYINIYQIGELGLECGGFIDEHIQICHEISYIVSGNGIFYTDNTAIPVSQGDIHVISKGTPHKIICNSPQRLRFIYLGFDFNSDFPDNELNDVMEFYMKSPLSTTQDFGEVRFLLDMLINELYAEPKHSKVIIESVINQILIYIYRLFLSYKQKHFIPNENKSLIGQTVYRIMKHIDNNIFEIKSIKSIATSLVYSESYISHLFKEKTGITIQEYIRNKKIEVSLDLLKSQKYTITEISNLLNYDTPQSFSKTFKKCTGYSPTNYRDINFKKQYVD